MFREQTTQTLEALKRRLLVKLLRSCLLRKTEVKTISKQYQIVLVLKTTPAFDIKEADLRWRITLTDPQD